MEYLTFAPGASEKLFENGNSSDRETRVKCQPLSLTCMYFNVLGLKSTCAKYDSSAFNNLDIDIFPCSWSQKNL